MRGCLRRSRKQPVLRRSRAYRKRWSGGELKPAMVGEVVLGRFRIEDRIGSGGFGTVYRAWDERLQRPVAVKVIDREHGSPRGTREAQAGPRLPPPNTPRP